MGASSGPIDLTYNWVGFVSLAIFCVAYLVVIGEEYLRLHKSKPVLIAAGLIWAIIGAVSVKHGISEAAEHALQRNLLEYAELMLFLLVAMTYINAMEERRIFDALRTWMVRKGWNYRALFWITGILTFFISPVADNLTTALLMCSVVLKVARGDRRFINICCINIVVAANAGGAFSPFGDITTLMVWQEGKVTFIQFTALFLPSVVNFLLPALCMHFFVPKKSPRPSDEYIEMKRGSWRIIGLFLCTIATAVAMHSVLHLPPVVGMMLGLGYLQFFGYYLRCSLPSTLARSRAEAYARGDERALKRLGNIVPFDVFSRIARAEWDTLLFFYGVVLCVGGLGFLGYLSMGSELLYSHWSYTQANTALGLLSAVIDNIPVMFAVLSMDPAMSLGQWLMITLTAGVGGSLLSIGSAAGVALMGQARGYYTFFGHLKWFPVLLVGYLASIWVHLYLNSALF
ncbi:sodium:proton antiporter NhaD [Dongshaea marina]|uniref:sodium:proton antiporter NhaD n=1 Tax=Dongshaea marina TaxID=2047966 RepID=UPI000D3E7264|nr:sodium:proton antiporter NhaD [Dongshaea marina]